MKVSKRISGIQPSPTLAITAKANKLKQEGKNVMSFGAGEPDFRSPPCAIDAATAAFAEGFTRYTASDGIPELKAAIIEMLERELGLKRAPGNVIVTVGGKQAIFNFMVAYLDPEDEVIIPAPYWVSYPEMVSLAGGKPVIVECEEKNNFLLTADKLRRAITKKTRALIINSPSNPTGFGYTEEMLNGLAQVIRDNRDVVILSDDVYRKITYAPFKYKHILQVAPDLADNIVIADSVSKPYSMTGWRIGWAVAEPGIIAAMKKVSDQTTSCPSSVSQRAAMAALKHGDKEYKEMLVAFERRRKLTVEGLCSIRGVQCKMPDGAFYAFAGIKNWIGKNYKGKVLKTDLEIADALIGDYLVAVVPGSAFGLAGYLRLSYATSDEVIKEGLKRIANFAAELKD